MYDDVTCLRESERERERERERETDRERERDAIRGFATERTKTMMTELPLSLSPIQDFLLLIFCRSPSTDTNTCMQGESKQEQMYDI